VRVASLRVCEWASKGLIMSDKQFDEREWGRRLEAGKESDPELLLAGQLRYFRPEPRPLPPHFKRELRGRLLQQYGERSAAGRLVEWGGSLAAGAVLVLAVMVVWVWLAGPDQRWGAATESGTNPETNAAGSLPVDLALSGTAAETARLQLELAALEEEGTATGWQLLALRQRPYRGNADLIQVEATLAWNLAEPPREVSFGLAHPEQGAEAGAAGMVVLSTAVITTATGSFELSAAVDPLEVWQQLGTLEPLLAITTAQTLDGLGTLAETVAFAAEPLSLFTPGRDRLWLISASPEPGNPLAGQTPFRVEIGYRLVSAPTADVRLHLVHPEWESAGGDGRLPINGAGDVTAVTYGEGTLTFDFVTEHLDYLQQVIGDRATLMAKMTTGGDTGVLDVLTLRNFSEAQWPIATSSAALPDRVWFISVLPGAGAVLNEETPFMLEVGYELHSATEGWVSLHLARPEQPRSAPVVGIDGLSVWSQAQLVSTGEGRLSFTGTIEDLPFAQAVIGPYATATAILSTVDEQGSFNELDSVTEPHTAWRLGETMIGIPRVADMEVTLLAESTSKTELQLLDYWQSSEQAQGLTPITVTVEIAYSLPESFGAEGTLLAFVRPVRAGITSAIAGGAVPAGEGRVVLNFSFNPRRDWGTNLRERMGWELLFALNSVDDDGVVSGRAVTHPGLTPPILHFEP
jgi:hypothetical protein